MQLTYIILLQSGVRIQGGTQSQGMLGACQSHRVMVVCLPTQTSGTDNVWWYDVG